MCQFAEVLRHDPPGPWGLASLPDPIVAPYVGDVRGTRSKAARVVRQYPGPGTVLGRDAEVGVKLGE